VSDRFFGYGSLVNLSTHENEDIAPATLSGWRRRWSHRVQRNGFKVSSLSVIRSPGSEIAGVTAQVPNGDWDALDRREHGYERLIIPPQELSPSAHNISVYKSLPENDHLGNEEFPILQSYLDCVLQGFLHVHGPSSAEAFVASTDGWETPILQDRTAPRYPRAITLSSDETTQIDHLLKSFPKL